MELDVISDNQCLPVVVGEAAWKVDWGVLYVGHA
jgi:hypothetical protein